jgi:GDP-4-dehydro-6-deoxy-D-mannose reductase
MANGPAVVTGATGFAGGHLLDRLLLTGGDRKPVAWHHPTGRPIASHQQTVDWQPVDLLDRDGVDRAIRALRPSRIYHLAGASHVGTSWQHSLQTLQINVLGTDHLLEAVRRLGSPCRVLVVSSALVYGDTSEAIDEDAVLRPSSPYGLSKLAQDQLALRTVAEDGLDVVVVRPFNHVGPRQDPSFALSGFARQVALIEAGRAPAEVQTGNLDARRDLTDVRDVVRAYERLMDAAPAGRPFNVCTGTAVRIGDLLQALIGLSTVRVRLTLDAARLRPNDTPVLLGNPSRIRAELGWTPAIDLARTLADTLDWWRAAVRADA